MARLKAKSPAKVVVIGGGTGVFTLLSGLKHYFEDLTAIISIADNGRSSGILREDFGILPPGDMRQAMVALSEVDDKILSDLFNYRFQEGRLKNHSFGNLMLTALERITGSFEKAIAEASRILAVKGNVVPVSLKPTDLCVELENGKKIRGETNIDISKHDGRLRIVRAWLEPRVRANPAALRAIRQADLVIVGPGDLYTSTIANLLVSGIPEAIRKSRGRVVYFVNIMTKYGETNGFQASDFVHAMEGYLGRHALDAVIVNTKRPSKARLRKYEDKRASFVENDLEEGFFATDLLRPEGFVRHDPEKTARFLYDLLGKTRRKR